MSGFDRLRAHLDAACEAGFTPGATCVVRRRGEAVHRSFHGRLRPGGAPVTADTVFDVASLTKVMATTTLAMALHAEGKLDLERPVADVVPEFAAGGKGAVTFADLLAHNSGLPAWRPYWERLRDTPLFTVPAERPRGEARVAAVRAAAATVLAAALAEPLERPRGTAAVYSDVGFIALGHAVSVLAGEGLDALFARRVAEPLGLARTGFVDEARPVRPTPCAPTRAAESRGGAVLEGEVDDDNAFALGGIAGHAGLFSTADEVAAFGEAVLRANRGETVSPLAPASVHRFLLRDEATPGSTRALGWDTPSKERSAAGRHLAASRAVGHLGFTGCSLWIDLDRELVVALLTNRVHLGTDPEALRTLRAEAHDHIVEALPA